MFPRIMLSWVLLTFVPAVLCGPTDYSHESKNRQIEGTQENVVYYSPFTRMKNSTLNAWLSSAASAEQVRDDWEQLDLVKNANYDECGIAGSYGMAQSSAEDNVKIAGGNETNPHQYPWQVLITNEERTIFCGGSIIYDNAVVTAAHCVQDIQKVYVWLEVHRLSSDWHGYSTRNIIIHPEWDRKTFKNDIAIIRLSSITFSDNVRRICLPKRADYTNEEVTLTGWGVVSDSSTISRPMSDALRAVNTTVITNEKCQETFKDIPETAICSDGSKSRGTCHADFGDPMNYYDRNTGKWTLIGVASFGYDTSCGEGYPSRFTRISSYLDWIQKTTGRDAATPAQNGSPKLIRTQPILALTFISCFIKLNYF